MVYIKNFLTFYKKNWKEITSGILSLSAMILTMIQFLGVKENEFRKSLFNEQFRLYEQLLDMSSDLCHLDKEMVSSKQIENELKEYAKFERGKLMLVNDNEVRNKVKTFFEFAVLYYESDLDIVYLENSLDSISISCRKSLQETFDVRLPELVLAYMVPGKVSELNR